MASDKIKTKGPVRIVAFLTTGGAYRVTAFERTGKRQSRVHFTSKTGGAGLGGGVDSYVTRNQAREIARVQAEHFSSVTRYEPQWLAEPDETEEE